MLKAVNKELRMFLMANRSLAAASSISVLAK